MRIVAITACAGGIAHTYMAAEALKKSARQAGDEIRIEIQGSMGVENRLTQAAIDQADLVVFAVNISIEGRDRFSKKKPIIVDPGEFVADGVRALEKVKASAGLV